MAENSGNGATPVLAFIVGGLIVVVAVIAFFMYSGGMGGGETKSVDVNIKAPDISAPAKAE
ncbi:hypothetical protein [Phenylobacterium sp.]|uniref:hypothetical protein n=1 Tax=Phenylobacterium sp. TaxID=1871053 RepID=UPI00286A4D19|nr:hypothetical protein [Phenylobacterium sp.]